MRRLIVDSCVVLALLAAASPVHAQDVPAGEVAPASPPPATAAAPAVPPVMVAVLAGDRVPAELADSVRAALVAQVTPMAGGRPVVPLASDTIAAALTACAEDAACVGRELAGAGAIGAVLARLSRTRRTGPVALALDLVDPVSGSPRLPRATASLAEGVDPAPTLAPLVEAFRPVMFSPPPAPPRLLVTSNVEGATVLVDGASVGTTPLGRLTLEPGRHTVTVTAAGYAASTRELEVGTGDERRIDVLLEPSTATTSGAPMDEVIVGTGTPRAPELYEEWWFWTIVGGVVVAGVAVGVGVGVATSQPPPITPDPMGIRLPEIR